MKYAISWTGTVQKTVPVDKPVDSLYHIWTKYRDDFKGGEVRISVESRGGVSMAQLEFPVVVQREVEAETPTDAVRVFLYDDSVPKLVHLRDISVATVTAEPALPFELREVA